MVVCLVSFCVCFRLQSERTSWFRLSLIQYMSFRTSVLCYATYECHKHASTSADIVWCPHFDRCCDTLRATGKVRFSSPVGDDDMRNSLTFTFQSVICSVASARRIRLSTDITTLILCTFRVYRYRYFLHYLSKRFNKN